MIQETSSGACCVNDVIVQAGSSEIPFGGVGQSGYGRVHGKAGFDNFSNMKGVLAKAELDFEPFNASVPPYSEETKE